MAYEVIDVVNENDEVVGTVERTPEWNATRPTVHRYANVFVLRTDGTFVIQRRGAKRQRPLNFDTAVGGLAPTGMTMEQVAAKEMQEELGIAGPLTYIGKVKDFNPVTGALAGFGYIYEIEHDGPYSNWEEEAERLEYFTAKELDYMTGRFPYMFNTGLIAAWKLYKTVKGQK